MNNVTEEFLISVRLGRRNYEYKVVYERIQERFVVRASQKEIVVYSQIQMQDGKETKRTYTYDREQASKKRLMNRIILAIDIYLKEKAGR